MKRPPRLKKGDTIGIVAPSSPIGREELEAGISYLEQRGYRVVVGANVLARHPENDYLTGTDEERAADLNEMLAREDIDGVLCARGGYGAMRLLDRLDWSRFEAMPKVFVGYSDITSLHAALQSRCGWTAIHGPMVSTLPKLDSTASEVFWSLVENPEPYGLLPANPDSITSMHGGVVEAELTGGCLCLLARACGSRYAPDYRGKIVLLEDVGEAVYRADRDLAQLKNAGVLEDAAGFVIGTITRWQKEEAEPPLSNPNALWRDYFAELGKPVIAGFPFGHEPNPLTLPLGVRARLDADSHTLTLLEAAVV